MWARCWALRMAHCSALMTDNHLDSRSVDRLVLQKGQQKAYRWGTRWVHQWAPQMAHNSVARSEHRWVESKVDWKGTQKELQMVLLSVSQ